MEMRTPIFLALLILLSLTTGIALAKDMVKVTITGPGLPGPIEVTNPKWLQALYPGELEDFQNKASPPYNLSAVYELARYFDNGAGGSVLIDRVLYRPNPSEDHGYVFPNGKWFYATSRGDEVMQEIINAYSTQHSEERTHPC